MTRREEIARVFADLAEAPETADTATWYDLGLTAADAILALPAQESTELVKRLRDWHDDPRQHLLAQWVVVGLVSEAASALMDQVRNDTKTIAEYEQTRQALTAERDDYKRKLDEAVAALGVIENLEPATQEMTLAHEMATLAREVHARLTEGK